MRRILKIAAVLLLVWGGFQVNAQEKDADTYDSPMKKEEYKLVLGFGKVGPFGKRKIHRGVDLAAKTGTPIYAAGGGKVVQAGEKSGYGNWIVLLHPDGNVSVYGHMEKKDLFVRKGESVQKGQLISRVGQSGTAVAPHLHFEMRELDDSLQYNQRDPENWITF